MINTTALLQKVPTQIMAATMGCRLENPNNLHSEGCMTYHSLLSLLTTLEQHIGQEKGYRHFGAHEITTEPNGEFKYRLTPTPQRAEPPTTKIQTTYP